MKNKKKLIDVMVHLPSEENPRVVGCLEADFEYSEVFKDYVLSEESSLKIDSMRASYLGRFDGQAVKKLRKRLGLTQQQMSSLLGLGAKTITRWESNKSKPSLSMSENLKRIELIKNLQDDGMLPDEYIDDRAAFLEHRKQSKEDEMLQKQKWASRGEVHDNEDYAKTDNNHFIDQLTAKDAIVSSSRFKDLRGVFRGSASTNWEKKVV